MTKYFGFLNICILCAIYSCNTSTPSPKTKIDSNTQPTSQKQLINYSNILTNDTVNYIVPVTYERNLKFDANCAFVNSQGDTVVPFGKYRLINDDTLKTFIFVKGEDGVYGVNMNFDTLFEAHFWGDCLMDDFTMSELIRVKRNGLIGYAEQSGKIVIPCEYTCAKMFKNGIAEVAKNCRIIRDGKTGDPIDQKSDNWIKLDKHGKKIE